MLLNIIVVLGCVAWIAIFKSNVLRNANYCTISNCCIYEVIMTGLGEVQAVNTGINAGVDIVAGIFKYFRRRYKIRSFKHKIKAVDSRKLTLFLSSKSPERIIRYCAEVSKTIASREYSYDHADYFTPLHWVMQGGKNKEVVNIRRVLEVIIPHVKDHVTKLLKLVDSNGNTPLHIAMLHAPDSVIEYIYAECNHDVIVQLLLQKNTAGLMPLDLLLNNPKVMGVLSVIFENITPLQHIAILKAETADMNGNKITYGELLLSKNLLGVVICNELQEVLLSATYNGQMIKLYITNMPLSILVDYDPETMQTPVHKIIEKPDLSLRQKSFRIQSILLSEINYRRIKQGVFFEDNDGNTPLSLVMDKGYLQIIEILIQALNAEDAIRALGYTKKHSRKPLLQILLGQGHLDTVINIIKGVSPERRADVLNVDVLSILLSAGKFDEVIALIGGVSPERRADVLNRDVSSALLSARKFDEVIALIEGILPERRADILNRDVSSALLSARKFDEVIALIEGILPERRADVLNRDVSSVLLSAGKFDEVIALVEGVLPERRADVLSGSVSSILLSAGKFDEVIRLIKGLPLKGQYSVLVTGRFIHDLYIAAGESNPVVADLYIGLLEKLENDRFVVTLLTAINKDRKTIAEIEASFSREDDHGMILDSIFKEVDLLLSKYERPMQSLLDLKEKLYGSTALSFGSVVPVEDLAVSMEGLDLSQEHKHVDDLESQKEDTVYAVG